MAAPTLTLLNSTSLSTAESTTGWTTFDTLDPDIVKEGSNSITGTFRNDGSHGYFNNGTAPTTAASKTFRAWVNTTSVPYLDTAANGGAEVSMYDGATTEYYTVFSSDDYYGGWFQIVVDCDLFTTLTLANVEQWGFRMQYTASAKNVDNCWIDALKYLDGYSMTGGTSGDEITLETIEVADRGTTTLYGYGIVTLYSGVYYGTGDIQFGTGATTTWFLMDGDILVFEDKPVAAGLYSLSGVGTGTRVTIQNSSTITSAGTTDDTRFVFDWSDADLLSFSCTDSLIVRASTSTFKSGQTVTGNTFNDCGQITHGGADMTGCSVKGYEGTAGTGAVLYDVATDPDGEMDNMAFEKGTASTHAIEFDATNTPTSITLRGIDFSGYNASNGNTDSALYFPSTTKSYTVNLVECTGDISYRVGTGGSVSLVADPVALTIIAKDGLDASLLSGARVLAKVSSGVNFPYNASVTITGSGTTATVAHTGHGLSTNDAVVILGADQENYNGAYTITVTGVDAYTYTTEETVVTSPATGTITSTFALLHGTTDVNGEITNSWTLSSAQPFSFTVRKATTAPFFVGADGSDQIETTADKDITVQLARDQ